MAGAGTKEPGQRAARLRTAGRLRRAARLRRGLAASAAAERQRAARLVRQAVDAATDAARHPADHPPPGPFRPGTWRSPLRGLWLTSVLAVVLLVGLTILAVTGLLSYAAYDPRLPGNDQTPGASLLKFYLFSWPTHPSWLYRVDQGVHITLGLALLPVVLAKLWSVLPRLFAWPPVRSLAQILERLSLIMVVGGVLFEFVTGILNIQNYYVFPFSFYTAHLYGAWVFIAGLVIHIALKFPRMLAGLRSRSLRRELHTPLAGTEPEEPDESGLRAARPAAPTISRRGLLAVVGGASLTLVAVVAGQSIGGLTPADRVAGTPGAVRRRGTRAAGQPDREVDRADRRGRRPGLPAGADRPDVGLADPRTVAGAAADLRRTASRLRGRLVVFLPVDRCAAGRPGPAGRDARAGRRVRPVDPAGRFRAHGPVRGPGDRSAVTARAEDERGGPARGITATRRARSSRTCRACTTPSGSSRSRSWSGYERRGWPRRGTRGRDRPAGRDRQRAARPGSRAMLEVPRTGQAVRASLSVPHWERSETRAVRAGRRGWSAGPGTGTAPTPCTCWP